MKLEALKKFCMSLEGTTQDVKWGADLCFCVLDKMYAVTGLEGGSISLKVPEPAFAGLVTRKGFSPAPYVARYHWVLVEEGAVTDAELKQLLQGSHAMVKEKNTRKKTKPRAAPAKPSKRAR